jgi:tetratricopeptide (TPR) repeat protein
MNQVNSVNDGKERQREAEATSAPSENLVPRRTPAKAIDLGRESLGAFDLLEDYIFCGTKPDPTPLTKRDRTISEDYREYVQMIRREYFQYSCHEPIPFAEAIVRILGVVQLFNPIAFSSFRRDTDGSSEFSLQQNANEKAYHHAVWLPLKFFQEGKIDAALKSFTTALSSAPGRVAESYLTLGHFCGLLFRLQRDYLGDLEGFERELRDAISFQPLASSLCSQVIAPEDSNATKMALLSYYSPFVLSQKNPPLFVSDIQSSVRALKESHIPFDLLAETAYTTALKELPEASSQTRLHIGALADYYGGRYFDAITKITSLSEANDPPCRDLKTSDLEVLTWSYRESGQFEQAVATWGLLLNHLINEDCDELNYTRLLELCKRRGDETGTSPWKIALPILRERAEPIRKFDNHLRQYYLGYAYRALGELDKALEHFERANNSAERKRLVYRLDGDSSPYVTRLNEIIEETGAFITRKNPGVGG